MHAHRIEISELVANSVAASLNGAKAAPCRGAGIEHLVNRGKRHGVAFGHDAARVCVLDFGAPFVQLAHDHGDALEYVKRLEPGDNARDVVFLGQKLVRLHSDDGAYVPRQNEGVYLQLGITHEHVECARHVLVRSIHAEIGESHRLGAFDCHGNERRGGFKANAYENDGTRGIFLGDRQCVEGRIYNANVASRGLFLKERTRGARYARHVSEGGDNHVRNARERDNRIDVVVARHAYGAARTACKAAAFGHERANAVSGNGDGVRSAYFHKGRMLGREGLDAIDEPACKHGVFETVLVNHGRHLHRGRGLHVFGEFGELANKVERFVRGLFAYHLNRESRMH